jgi:hypothetical protein
MFLHQSDRHRYGKLLA